jgi:hypothetical protein
MISSFTAHDALRATHGLAQSALPNAPIRPIAERPDRRWSLRRR